MHSSLGTRDVLHGDVLCNTLCFLGWKDVMTMRLVASSWKDAVMETPVDEQVYVKTQGALEGLCQCLPELMSLKLDQDSNVILVGEGEKEPMLYRYAKLQHFQCLHTNPSLIQSYNFQKLMSKWQNLKTLNLHGNETLEWNLLDLSSLRNLHDIRCINNRHLRGDTQDLLIRRSQHAQSDRSDKTDIFQNLTILDISGCSQVTGKLCDFCKVPNLIWLGINRTRVSGDLRYDICPGDFVALQGMGLCSDTVYGANQIQSVQDAYSVMRARLQIMKQSSWESPIFPLMLHLSPESPDYHERIEQRLYSSERDPPFSIETVLIGNRWGWRWSNYLGGFCETHWLDDPPDEECEEYEKEFVEFQRVKSLFSGFLEPPTWDQYQMLCEEW